MKTRLCSGSGYFPCVSKLTFRVSYEPLCVDCQCRFRNVGALGFQHAEDKRVDEDKQTMGGKNEGRTFCGEDAEEQW